MPQSLTSLVYHIVFSTKNRQPLLKLSPVRHRLYEYLGGIIKAKNGAPVIIGGTEDHIHLLTYCRAVLPVPELVKEVKRSSTLWLKLQDGSLCDFAWQGGYGAFTLDSSQLEGVVAYIKNQEEHHREVTYQQEYLKFLHRHNVAYDERYLWD